MEDVVYSRKGTRMLYCAVGDYLYVRRLDGTSWKMSAFTVDEFKDMIANGVMMPILPPE